MENGALFTIEDIANILYRCQNTYLSCMDDFYNTYKEYNFAIVPYGDKLLDTYGLFDTTYNILALLKKTKYNVKLKSIKITYIFLSQKTSKLMLEYVSYKNRHVSREKTLSYLPSLNIINIVNKCYKNYFNVDHKLIYIFEEYT